MLFQEQVAPLSDSVNVLRSVVFLVGKSDEKSDGHVESPSIRTKRDSEINQFGVNPSESKIKVGVGGILLAASTLLPQIFHEPML